MPTQFAFCTYYLAATKAVELQFLGLVYWARRKSSAALFVWLEVEVSLQRIDASLRQRGDLATGRTREGTTMLGGQVFDAASAVRVMAGQEARVCDRFQPHGAGVNVLFSSRHHAELYVNYKQPAKEKKW
jgi:hypothetical protein